MRYFHIKTLYRFILKSFLPLFAMTFFIVLFIVLMQFLWKYIDDMVGKGLGIDVLGELFFYAAVSLVPMALPLAILLASLMTFGNLGEKFELTAIKASGISLIKVMTPLIVLISGVAVGAFFFQNNVLPHAQVKMWTLLFSMRQKSPELEIPEGVFYSQIPGYNIFVKEKDQKTGMLRNVIIYDTQHGSGGSTILQSDSARLAMTKDMTYLYLHLYNGEQFENLREETGGSTNVPFRRETFLDKQILIPFDANFNRMDDDQMRRQYVGKNIEQLQHTIDSVGQRLDSMAIYNTRMITSVPVVGIVPEFANDTASMPKAYRAVKLPTKVPDIDSLLAGMADGDRRRVFSTAMSTVRMERADMEMRSIPVEEDMKTMRRHEIELVKKFTLSVACLIFFFIGAPLGAIIRRGGIGTPLVISVLLFLVYYIIDNTGYKMARDGRWPVWFGMWLSTFILTPLGIFVTYKAMNDSAVFQRDQIVARIKRILGLKQKRTVNIKEVIIAEFNADEAVVALNAIAERADALIAQWKRPQGYREYWMQGYDQHTITEFSEQLEETIEMLRDCPDHRVTHKLDQFPVIRRLPIYGPEAAPWLRKTILVTLIAGVPVWLIGRRAQRTLLAELRKVATLSRTLISQLQD